MRAFNRSIVAVSLETIVWFRLIAVIVLVYTQAQVGNQSQDLTNAIGAHNCKIGPIWIQRRKGLVTLRWDGVQMISVLEGKGQPGWIVSESKLYGHQRVYPGRDLLWFSRDSLPYLSALVRLCAMFTSIWKSFRLSRSVEYAWKKRMHLIKRSRLDVTQSLVVPSINWVTTVSRVRVLERVHITKVEFWPITGVHDMSWLLFRGAVLFEATYPLDI